MQAIWVINILFALISSSRATLTIWPSTQLYTHEHKASKTIQIPYYVAPYSKILPGTTITGLGYGGYPAADGCSGINSLTQRRYPVFIVFRASGCDLATKVENAEKAGGKAILIVGDIAVSPISRTLTANLKIPVIIVSTKDSEQFWDIMAEGGENNGFLRDFSRISNSTRYTTTS